MTPLLSRNEIFSDSYEDNLRPQFVIAKSLLERGTYTVEQTELLEEEHGVSPDSQPLLTALS